MMLAIPTKTEATDNTKEENQQNQKIIGIKNH